MSVDGLPALVADVVEAAPRGAHAADCLQVAEHARRHGLTPSEAWAAEVEA
jgi:hypothetical protein